MSGFWKAPRALVRMLADGHLTRGQLVDLGEQVRDLAIAGGRW